MANNNSAKIVYGFQSQNFLFCDFYVARFALGRSAFGED